jgi:CheY-like chemotaxis protein
MIKGPGGTKSRRVVYVDDDAFIAKLVKRFFEQEFPTYEVLTAVTATEALQRVRERLNTKEFPQAVITDVRLDGKSDSAELVRSLRQEFPRLRMIAVSAVTDPRDVAKLQAAGVNAFVEKQLNMRDFVNRIFDLLQCPTDLLPERGLIHAS